MFDAQLYRDKAEVEAWRKKERSYDSRAGSKPIT
jgi:hypothetical protein